METVYGHRQANDAWASPEVSSYQEKHKSPENCYYNHILSPREVAIQCLLQMSVMLYDIINCSILGLVLGPWWVSRSARTINIH
jgi:hypothetical protein